MFATNMMKSGTTVIEIKNNDTKQQPAALQEEKISSVANTLAFQTYSTSEFALAIQAIVDDYKNSVYYKLLEEEKSNYPTCYRKINDYLSNLASGFEFCTKDYNDTQLLKSRESLFS